MEDVKPPLLLPPVPPGTTWSLGLCMLLQQGVPGAASAAALLLASEAAVSLRLEGACVITIIDILNQQPGRQCAIVPTTRSGSRVYQHPV